MILVDTSIWIDHLHSSEPDLLRLLDSFTVCTHPLIVGELAMGSLARRDEILEALSGLPQVPEATHTEVAVLIERHSLFGRGLSLVDAQRLAALRIDGRARLWTRDRRLRSAAEDLGVLASELV